MSDKQTAWTRLSEQMPKLHDYPCLVRWCDDKHTKEIFHAASLHFVCATTSGAPFITFAKFFPVLEHAPLMGFEADSAEWAPIPE